VAEFLNFKVQCTQAACHNSHLLWQLCQTFLESDMADGLAQGLKQFRFHLEHFRSAAILAEEQDGDHLLWLARQYASRGIARWLASNTLSTSPC
jgi:hypothetical protein